MHDFGYAEARQLIRVRASSALDQETMPRAVSAGLKAKI
jgi:hypothetical protein